jgi:hypothetical protein
MSERVTTLLAEALNLPEEERGQLAYALLDSLEGSPSNIDAEFLRDPSVGVPWEEVKRMTKID